MIITAQRDGFPGWAEVRKTWALYEFSSIDAGVFGCVRSATVYGGGISQCKGRSAGYRTYLCEEAHKLADASALVEAETAQVIDLAEERRCRGRCGIECEEGERVDLHDGWMDVQIDGKVWTKEATMTDKLIDVTAEGAPGEQRGRLLWNGMSSSPFSLRFLLHIPAMSDTLPRDLWARQLEALPPRTILTTLTTHAHKQSHATDHLADYLRARASVEQEYVQGLQKIQRKFGGDGGFEERDGEGVVWERTVGELGLVSLAEWFSCAVGRRIRAWMCLDGLRE